MEHSFNKVIDLLFLAREEGVELVMNDERLQLKVGVNKAIDETLLKEIRNNKQLIIDYLKSDNWQATRVTKNNNHKITRFDRDSLPHIPLSFSQERLWFIDHLEGSVQYHSPAVMRLVGNLNKEALLYALRAIISRQDALRTVFHEIDGKVYQSLKTNEDWELQLVDGSAYKEDAGALKLYIEKLVKEPFDLANDYPIRGSLIRLDDQEHILVVTMHHIASDAWSISIIVKEVVELYSSFVQGRQANLETLPVQYADFAVWQRNYLQGAILEKKINYWKNKLEGQEPLQLPTDYTRPPVRSTRGASTGFKIEKELAGQLHELSRQQGVSLFMLLLAAFKVLLQRYSSQEDISVGTSIASRQQKELEGLVGFFVNTLALRTEFSSDISFAALLEKVKSTTLEAYEHQEIPFDKVVEIAVSERDPSRSPLFQVMLVLQNTPESSKLKLGELVLSAEPFVTNVAKFDITLFITETPNGFMGSVDYSTDLYQADTMKRMTDHFTTLLRSVVADPQQKIGLLTMLSNEEERQLVEQFNSAAVAYPKDKTFVELFEEQVVKTPGNIALVFEKDQLSYRELNERSNQLAHYLKSKGVKPNSLVPLYMERSASMIIGLLGIMKAGAAYVPVDTDFPADRISYMLQDAGASIIVSSKAARISLEAEADAEIIEIEDPLLERHPSGNLPVKPSTNHLAYVIYTSGSTGRPKGVMIEHCSLVDYYYGLNKYTHIDQCSSFALVSTIATDLGNTVIYASLLSGGALHVFTKESVSNIEYLHRYFREVQIECVKIVPSHWKALSTTEELLLPSKLLVFGGETLQAENVAAIRMSGSLCQVVNHYGPTETTVGKLLHLVQPEGNYEKRIPVGKPFSNTQVYVLSRNMQLCPIGVPGKLYIAGDGVARGYFNNRELTEEKFILNPFKLAEHRGAKMYATGDLVKWLPDGNIEFIGRVDNQVQIRGYRVEPGEVENVLEQCEQVKQGVVLAKLDRQGNNRLIAYVVANEVFDREEIVDYLKKKLPEYMIPAVLMEVERIPLTANGKINRKALPDPDVAEIAGDKYVAPRNETEEKLARIWAEVLEVDQVGVHDDFFELGGHSLLAVRLISAMRKAFNVEMPIGDIFDYPTVAMLSARVPGKKDTVVLPSIEPVHPRPEYIPLSFSQERLWFLDRLQGSQQYHVPAVLRLTGKLNKAALAAALQNVVNRHEVLRTVILQREGISYQQITGKDSWQLSVVDGSVYKDNQSALQRYIQELIFAPFDLPKDHMMRAHLIAFGDEEYVLVFNMHHIASDGWSRSILVQEVVEGYSAFENGRPINLPALPVQYADYAIWQRNHVQGEILEKKLGYWKDKLHDITPLQLPTDFSRPKVQSARGASAGFVVDERTLQQLHELSTQQGVTLFMTLLAAFNVLLHRYSGQQDICVGTPVAGRQQQELEGLIGFFVNTLALRSEVDGSLPFNTLLKRVKATTLEAYEHQEIPFEKVVDSVVKERDLSRNPLFQVMLVLRNTPDVPELNLGEVSLKREARTYSTSLFEISLFITENAHGLQCAMEYSTDLFTEATIGRMTVHFKELLHSIIESPEQQVALLPIVSAEEKQQLLVDFNDTLTPYPVDKSIVALFEEQVAKTPRAVAVIFEKKQLSFTELNRRANQLAHYLVSKGIGGEMRVPICIERSPEMIVAILGILKTGAAFLPVDPEYPVERINYLIANTGAEIVISNQESRTKLQKIQGPGIILIDTDWPLINKQPATNLQIPVSPQQLAYVIYTSGSTGMPKGVLIEHGGVVNLLKSIDHTVGFTSGSGLLSVTTFSFDIFYLECFMPLINGARLFIVSREIATNGFKLATSIHLHQPTHIQATPATWQLLLDAGWENKEGIKILVGGEAIREEIKDALTKIGDVYNLYGPTETTIWSVTKKLEKDEKVLIGKPIANTSIYIVGEAMQMTPIGVVGEICIGGVGLARGYLNQAILTAEKFIGNSFSTTTGARIYKTGDLGRWLPDGNIEYLGRIDDQVKIRGYRIELGEIENTLQQSGLVAQAAVVAKENKYGDKQLVAYIVPQGAFSKDEIVIFLKDKLPAYMVPPLLMEIESLPLTPNGKVDKKALPDPEVEKILIHEYVAPRTATEIALAEIWQDLLGIERVGIRDNFFDLGGHSLLAMRVVAAVRKRLNIELLIKDIFVFDTIGKLAIHLEAQSTGLLLPAIEAKPRPEFIPLSFSQERLWFIDLLEGSEQYHIPAVLQLQGKLSFAALQQALKTIISRHQVLRTVIHEKEGLGNQYVIDENNFSINRVDGTPYRHDRQGLLELVAGFVKAPFDLSADYMLRAVLIQLAAEEFVLVVTMHHIASDGWSMSVLVNEFAELYRSFIEERPALLADLPIQYADYAIWQRTNLTGALWDKKIGYWKEKLEGVLPLDLPTDYARPAVLSTRGAVSRFKIDQDLTNRLHNLSRQQEVTLFMTLLSVLKVLLYRYSGQQDICVGTPVVNRTQKEVEGLIGFFVNTLALRSEVDGKTTFTELLQQVKLTTFGAYEHQEVPFEKVVDAVVRERDMSRSPLFQVMLVLQNTPDLPDVALGGLRLSGIPSVHTTSKFDLTFSLIESADNLYLSVEYCTDLFYADTINRMAGHFVELLHSVVKAPLQTVDTLPMLSSAEENQLLVAFNDTTVTYPANKTIVDLFEEQAAKTPERIAVVFEEEQLSYEQLNTKANQLAHYLRSKGITEDTLVPVCIERSVEMIVAVMGILKAGAAYVPIDPEYPQERIAYMLADTAAALLISSKESSIRIAGTPAPELIEIDRIEDILVQQPAHNPALAIASHQLSYVIYTSGSTGKPKGVMVQHSNLYAFICWCQQEFSASHFDMVYATTSICFDLSVFEIFYPLSIGKPVRIVADGLSIGKHLPQDVGVLINTVPVVIRSLLQEDTDLSHVTVINMAGEPIPVDVQQKLEVEKIEVRNLYGPTEDTTYSTVFRLRKGEAVRIGKPISNTTVHIINKAGGLVPVGVAGEICLGGLGVTSGYLHQAALTKEKFVGNPFSTAKGARMYKTGDLGRWLADGNIEYLGRIDEQVKVRGYRIELGEIEAVLQQSGLVTQAVVVARQDNTGNKQLVGYVVPQGAFNREAIVAYLSAKLPEYMVPQVWVQMETLPLTPNGKVDKKALPDVGDSFLAAAVYVAPRNPLESALTEIWQELLSVERIGIYENFFILGGHSLLAMRLVSAIRKQLQAEMPIRSLFLYPTIASLAAQLETGQEGVMLLPAIEVQPRPAHIPLSFSQERLWFIDRLQGSVQYHIPAVLRLQGLLDVTALSNALQQIVNRHEVLRTVIREEEGADYQFIKDKDGWQLQVVNGSIYTNNSEGLHQYIKSCMEAPFDLSADYMLRATLISLEADNHILIATLHHIASDGWSTSIMVAELAELYNAAVEQRTVSLLPLPVQYADYALWQRRYLQGEAWEKKLGYWKDKLQGTAPLQLPTDYNRPPVQSNNGAITGLRIDKQLSDALQTFSQQQGTTLFMTLLATFNVLLYRYSNQQDICVGTPIAGRQQQELEGLIGFFVNTLALRSEVDGSLPFTSLLQQVKATTLEAYEHQEIPFEKVVEAIVKDRDMSRSPLFQVMLVLQNTPEVEQLQLGQLQLSRGLPGMSSHTSSKFDLIFNVSETVQGLSITIEYCTDLFYADTINRMAGHFVELLHSVVKAPLQTVDTLPMLSSAEENQLLVAFNDTTVTYPANKTIVDLFEEQAAKTPEHIAVVFEEEQLSYEQLNTKANQLAHYLRSKGVTEDTLVPVCIERSVEMIVAVMGILKAGAAYVPIDPEYPQERIAYMLADTAAALLISSKESSIRIAGTPALELIEIDRIEDILVQQPAHNPALAIASHQLSYVIYTSGSTGKPKGVMVQHSNLYAFICWCRQEFSASHFDMVYATTSICFDLSVFEIFYPLSIGKPVRIVADGLSIGKHLPQDVGVLINTVPVVIRSLLQEGTDLSHVTVINMAGEPIPVDVQQKLEVEKIEVRNLYGPTEDTTYSTVFRLRKGEAVRIGKPISNTTVHIVNKAGGLVPVGVAGEICLGGLGVTSGYLHQAALTKEKFVGNPFSTAKGARMYKTGDLGRWLADGNIEYLGRIDEQVKVRGYRIELGEIEAVLQQSGLVKQAVVAVKNDRQSDKLLVAYIVPQGAFNKNEIIAFLKDKLPAYMVPQLLMEMESLPLTPNGKVDKKALPDPDAEKILIHEYVAPRTATEIALAEIWQDLLGIEQVGIYEDFFSLGGHSLLAMRLVSAIRKKLQAEIAIRSLFQHSTIAALAEHLQTQQETLLLPAIEVQPRPAHIPLSFSQERLWFIDRLQGSVQYHIPAVLRLQGTLDVTALSNALQQIVNRHEVLRTVIREEEGTGYQQVKEAGGWQLEIIDGSIFKDDSPGLQQLIGNSIKAPFDLSTDYMLRATLISLDEENHVLLANVHHIASDGWSISIIVRELAEFYNSRLENRQIRLLLLPVQYADYALWQRRYLQGEAWEKKLGYWKDKLQGTAPLQLPTDYNRPPVQSNNGAITGLRIDKQISDALQTFSQQQGTTLFMTLLATFNVLLYRYSNQQDICVGTPIAGRQQQELEGLIGFFVNTLALRSEVDGSLPFTSLLQQVKATTLEAYEHQEIPFEKVVEAIVKDRDMSRSPLFQVMLVLQNTPEVEQLQLGQLQLSRGLPGMSSHTSSKFDLIFNVSETSRGLALTVEYCTDLYGELTVSRMMAHFLALLHSVVKAPLQTVDTLPMLSVAEEKQLLIAFNDTTADYPTNKTIVELFEEQAAKTPEHTAVVFGEEQLSYGELNTKANQLASYLRKKGVEQETLVPLCMERNIEMIIAVVAILKAGAAYVPIDPEYPQERIAYMLEDMGVALLISTEQSVSRLATAKSYAVVNPLEEALFIHKEPATNRPLAGGADKLLYVLYTSGSTGRPKGVRMANSALVNLLSWQQKQFINKGNRRVLQFASLNFDVSFQEIFSTLCFGGRLYLIAEERRKDITEMLSDIDKYAITHLFLPYIVLKTLAEYAISLSSSVSSLEEMMIAGEQLKLTDDIRKLLSNSSIKLINQYGPTEAHVVSSYTINTEKDVSALPPIGKPIDNTYLYILGAGHQLVPVGVAGELYIGGVQVARGYLNLPELTAERFMSDPFRKEVADSRMYKTGDLARWLPDGNIEYLGRIDGQVKVRGYRIELGEIEAVLQQSKLVEQAVVVAKEDSNGNKNLIAYVVTAGVFDQGSLISYLKAELPAYMVPQVWVQMEHFPLTNSGKIDRQALPDPGISQLSAKQYEAPRDELETRLVNIWQELLGISQVGIHDNFFDIGGHSLYAIRLVWLIRKKMNISVSVNDIFIYPTVAALAGNIVNKVRNPSLPDLNIKYLVPIKTTGSKPPLYVVAGGGGTALKIKKFAEQLDAGQPVYVFQPPIGDADLKGFPDTIEGIATVFIEELLIQNPDGPYALSGHCIGGIVAFEMAKQLQLRGKKVHSLAMFDTIIRRQIEPEPGTLKNLYHIPSVIQRSLSRFMLRVNFQTYMLRNHPRQSMLYKVNTFRSIRNRIKRKNFKNDYLKYAGEEIFEDSIEIYIAAYKNYKLHPYDGKIILFFATDRYFFLDRNNNIGYKKMLLDEKTKTAWNDYATNTTVYEIKGEHSDIFAPIHGEEFAKTLQKHLDRP